MKLGEVYDGRRVLITGHTGFKGTWLTQWLVQLGARVSGLALPAVPGSMFEQLRLAGRISHAEGDIRHSDWLRRVVSLADPEFVFHLASQALVRRSYADPIETLSTNIGGLTHLLEALRSHGKPCAVVIVTSDKCYRDQRVHHSYVETDQLGGDDPYSASKACAELVSAAYRRAFLAEKGIRLATARAGNVIGGGDWSENRIIPDCVRALQRSQPILIRHPQATRPWQHVLEPLSGYLWLAAQLQLDPSLAQAFNFGPGPEGSRSVSELVETVLKFWPGRWVEDFSGASGPHEADLLQLDTEKAKSLLRWTPTWQFAQGVEQTVRWYQAAQDPSRVSDFSRHQLKEYQDQAKAAGQPWAS